MHFKSALVGAALAALTTGPGAAARELNDIFSISGFGTVSLVHSSESNADFVTRPVFQPVGAGYTHSWSADVDSRLGLQLDAKFSDKLSATIQLVSESADNNSWNDEINPRYRPSLEWANLKYAFTPDMSVRVGRFALPTFLMSDYRKVGYALTEVRAPVPVYGMIPMTSCDGMDVTYRFFTPEVTHTLHGNFGRSTAPSHVAKLKFEDQWGVYYMAERGPTTLRFSYSRTRVRLLDPATDQNIYPSIFQPTFGQFSAVLNGIPGLESVGAEAASIAARYSRPISVYKYLGVAANYDSGSWLLTAEWVRQTNDDLLANQKGWYAMAAYKARTLTPFVSFARLDADMKSDDGLPLAQLPPGVLQQTGAALNGLLTTLLGANYEQRDIAVGMRWDVASNMALTAQYDRYEFPPGASGFLTNIQSGFKAGGSLNLVSVSLDFIF